jgi:putative transposase
MSLAQQIAGEVGVGAACAALGVSRASLYRRFQPDFQADQQEHAPSKKDSALGLSTAERQKVLSVLQSERFMDASPRQVWATLLDEGTYLCSVSTMYRLLRQEGQLKERRRQRRVGSYKKPELLATGANQVWSWDITKLKGPLKWRYYYLYVILDIYSRYVVGWMVAERECQSLAQCLIEETCSKQGILPGQLTIHADRGSSMTSKSVALLLSDLGVEKTHSRPHTSNDNPFSEAQFKTVKYCPDFPERFGCLVDARRFCEGFFGWYNAQHHHTGIALLTPEVVHYGRAEAVLAARQATLLRAFAAHPERFGSKLPQLPSLPEAVWINPPSVAPLAQGAT